MNLDGPLSFAIVSASFVQFDGIMQKAMIGQ